MKGDNDVLAKMNTMSVSIARHSLIDDIVLCDSLLLSIMSCTPASDDTKENDLQALHKESDGGVDKISSMGLYLQRSRCLRKGIVRIHLGTKTWKGQPLPRCASCLASF